MRLNLLVVVQVNFLFCEHETLSLMKKFNVIIARSPIHIGQQMAED